MKTAFVAPESEASSLRLRTTLTTSKATVIVGVSYVSLCALSAIIYNWAPPPDDNCIAPPAHVADSATRCPHPYLSSETLLAGYVSYCVMIVLALPQLVFFSNSATAPLLVLEIGVCAISATCFFLEYTGYANVAMSSAGLEILLQRYLSWGHTVAPISIALGVASGSSLTSMRRTITTILTAIVAGALASLQRGWVWGLFSTISVCSFAGYMRMVWLMWDEVLAYMTTHASQGHTLPATKGLRIMHVICWSSFGALWYFHQCGVVSTRVLETYCVFADVFTKIVFSKTLTSINVFAMEVRRNEVMRAIEASSAFKTVKSMESALDKKSGMLSNVSHELRTPLNGIICLSENLVKGAAGELPAVAKKQMSVVHTSAHRLLTMINDIVDAAALKEGKLRLRKEYVRVHGVAAEVIDLARFLTKSGVKLQNKVDPDCVILGDSTRLAQILNNLIGNACKFCKEGSITVGSQPSQDNKYWEVFVRDTGIGIASNRASAIFEAFEQADNNTASVYGGTGLGLNITRELVLAQEGTVRVESELGEGTTFFVSLPRPLGKVPDFAGNALNVNDPPTSESVPSSPTSPSLHAGRLVDGSAHGDVSPRVKRSHGGHADFKQVHQRAFVGVPFDLSSSKAALMEDYMRSHRQNVQDRLRQALNGSHSDTFPNVRSRRNLHSTSAPSTRPTSAHASHHGD